MTTMRDEFFNNIYEHAKIDRNIVILSADFSAPSLDKFRLDLPSQYIFMGISEQNMMLVAAGLALEGKKPICYAIAPFATLRCFEQIKLYASGMKLPIIIVGVGAGVAYTDSGYTHHALEDIAVMRSLPHMKIFQPCDNEDIRQMVEIALYSDSPIYLRLDRYGEDKLFEATHTVSDTFSVVKEKKQINLLASGSMMKIASRVVSELEQENIIIGLINANIIPINSNKLKKYIEGTDILFTLEEHTLLGGIGSHVLETISDLDINVKVKRLGFNLENGYVSEFGTREEIYSYYGLDVSSIKKYIKKYVEGK